MNELDYYKLEMVLVDSEKKETIRKLQKPFIK